MNRNYRDPAGPQKISANRKVSQRMQAVWPPVKLLHLDGLSLPSLVVFDSVPGRAHLAVKICIQSDRDFSSVSYLAS